MSAVPNSRVDGFRLARLISDLTVGCVVAKVRGLPTGLVTEKEPRPVMAVHRLRGTGRWQCDLQYPNKRVLKNDFVAAWRCLDRIAAFGKAATICSHGSREKTSCYQESD